MESALRLALKVIKKLSLRTDQILLRLMLRDKETEKGEIKSESKISPVKPSHGPQQTCAILAVVCLMFAFNLHAQ
jgi:hypothetical protein